jgi:SAM-dependent methyltransferase
MLETSKMPLNLRALPIWALLIALAPLSAAAQTPPQTYRPSEGQPGKDVVWIPSPEAMVGKMLDLAKVTPRDFVVDLGSGDGRNVIAAARRGARALGVEYNPDLVELSRRNAVEAGVAEKAQFVQGDMFEADISRATVMILFLITDNLRRLTPKFLALKPGTRIVSNTFEIPGWGIDQTYKLGGDCVVWCSAYLYIVPARVAGNWRTPQGELTLTQEFQTVSGTLNGTAIEGGNLRGDRIRFKAGGTQYSARVSGDAMKGDTTGSVRGAWNATRVNR